MKKYMKNDKILDILKEKYRGKYGKINRISQNFKHFYSEIQGKIDKNSKILNIILKLKYREKQMKMTKFQI